MLVGGAEQNFTEQGAFDQFHGALGGGQMVPSAEVAFTQQAADRDGDWVLAELAEGQCEIIKPRVSGPRTWA